MKRAISAFFVTTGTVAAIVLAPGTAMADATAVSMGGGARAEFQSSGEILKACDLAGNGLRAVAFAHWTGSSGVIRIAEVQDADGANGNCVEGNLDINDNIRIRIEACERNGQYGTPQNCMSSWTVT